MITSKVLSDQSEELLHNWARWCDFVLYCPALKAIGKDLTIIKVERDNDYIEEMQSGLLEFNELVNDYQTRLEIK